MTHQDPTALLTATDTASLLEQANTQWQIGDWHSLAKLQRESLQHHPDRAKLALLAAAGRLQTDKIDEARQYICLAKDWGVNKTLLTRILAAGVHNSLGRAAAIAGEHSRALQHLHSAIATGYPGSKARLLAQARISHQYRQLGLPPVATCHIPDDHSSHHSSHKLKTSVHLSNYVNEHIPLFFIPKFLVDDSKSQNKIDDINQNKTLVSEDFLIFQKNKSLQSKKRSQKFGKRELLVEYFDLINFVAVNINKIEKFKK